MSTASHYSMPAKILHWLIAGLIVSQYVLAKLAENAEHSDRVFDEFALMSSHKSIGMTILMLAVLRLLWRLFNTPPQMPATLPSWQQRAAVFAHWSMYLLIFAIPVSGWLMSSASDHSVNWFKLFVFPDLVLPSESLADIFHEVHEILGKLLFVIAVVHIAAALKHHFKDKDDVLTRMASLGGWLLFIVTIAIVLGAFGRFAAASEAIPAANPVAPTAIEAGAEKQLLTALPLWKIDYADSYIKFTGDQSGTPFVAEWQRWNAKMRFDTGYLQLCEFDVAIDTSSVLSDDSERDAYIVDEDFFDVANFSQARFQADQFTVTPGGNIEASGSLTMKGLSKPAVLTFTVKEKDRKIILTGTSTLDRFDWNIGMGDWTDTGWVGKDVTVEVRVAATI